MSLKDYFTKLIEKVEASDEISNAGKDKDGFYKPVRTVLLRDLNLLKDLHDKPRAKEMVKVAWDAIVKVLPPEMLILTPKEKSELKKILS